MGAILGGVFGGALFYGGLLYFIVHYSFVGTQNLILTQISSAIVSLLLLLIGRRRIPGFIMGILVSFILLAFLLLGILFVPSIFFT